ncbi:2-oxoacid:ferredoxin oxidoreductase subunit beta [Streptomyces chartreusis]|uniref:2-oxoacid:ferredoxin oxidoreductase subunit beta n=1 Tax=Streptomyces chartreusis TaxID=1969 RepID=UPI003634E8DD
MSAGPQEWPRDGLALVPTAEAALTAADFASDQEVRWCPGCGDYGVLAAFKQLLPSLGIPRENTVFISGIGCSSRFPYYLETYGMHSVHGRAPAIATGLAITRPDLSVWVITGDGDALSIGGNHLIHALRRNVNIKIILFNNRVYGLTKGQYSPTSPAGTVTRSSPAGSPDHAFNPVSLALGAEASFVARAIDLDRAGLIEVLTAAAHHRGSAFVEILQDCPVFNAGAMDTLRDPHGAAHAVLRLEQGAEMRFGPPGDDGRGTRVVVRDGFRVRIATATDVASAEVLCHDETDLEQAFALSRLIGPTWDPTPVGVIRRVRREAYDDTARSLPGTAQGSAASLQDLLDGTESWETGGSRR